MGLIPHTDHMEMGSLSEVNSSIDPGKKRTAWGKILAFFGPAYLVSVGYMDPGNWATDIAGGSRYGYTLLWVLLMSNMMALLLQSLSARLGMVRGRDLAQASRESFHPVVNFVLYILAEIAIAACDLAEVLGMAIGLQLLFHIPIIAGVGITIFDTVILLFLQRLGMRKMEMFIISLIAIIGLSFFMELIFANPDAGEVVKGLVPSIPDNTALYIAIGIIGATVMPHNLYLHSSLVQTRKIDRKDTGLLKKVLRYSVIDSAIALNIAFLVNASILILAASVFHKNGLFEIADIQDAHKLLAPLLGQSLAPVLFAVALIASGQSSTITGTLAGQIVMEGYLHLRIPIWIRRLITRLLAVVPAFFIIYYFGEESTGEMLVLSQVILSVQLGFAVIPLIHFVSNRRKMGSFAIKPLTQIVAWICAVIIVGFNIKLIYDVLLEWFSTMPGYLFLKVLVLAVVAGLGIMLVYIVVEPLYQRRKTYRSGMPHGVARKLQDFEAITPKHVAITVDFSDMDRKTIQYALAQGGKEAMYYLIHIVETPNAMLSEREVNDMESAKDAKALNTYVKMLQDKGYQAEIKIGYGRRAKSIAAIVNELGADLLVMGAHGHKGLKDVIFGETINTVRHKINAPLLAVK